MTLPERRLSVRPVSPENWDDFVRLFSARGAPHYCFCAAHRVRDLGAMDAKEKEAAMRRLVLDGTPIGVLAYDGEEPVGWCSVAPRESYVKLSRSRTMPRATPPGVSTWAVMCFYVPRSRRKQGVARALLKGAVAYARSAGARVVEGYPFDAMGISSTHRGHSSMFAAVGFHAEGKRWWRSVARK